MSVEHLSFIMVGGYVFHSPEEYEVLSDRIEAGRQIAGVSGDEDSINVRSAPLVEITLMVSLDPEEPPKARRVRVDPMNVTYVGEF